MKLPRLNSEGKWDNFYKWDEFYRDKVIYNYLFCGKNHRELDREVLGKKPEKTHGFESRNILNCIGLEYRFRDIFSSYNINTAISVLRENDEEHYKPLINILLRIKENLSRDKRYYTIEKETYSEKMPEKSGDNQKVDTVMDRGTHQQKFLTRVSGGENVILYGVPGVGKSWTIANEYCSDETRMERIVFHPDYTYSDFVGQILPSVTEDGMVRYSFLPGPFTSLLKRAYDDPLHQYFLIIEELNRGNAPAIFGDIFQLLDRKTDEELEDGEALIGTSEYGITNASIAQIVYGDPAHKVKIPSNMSIIGTMNTSDQNVFTLDTAFQRRWQMRMIENNFEHADISYEKIWDTGVCWKDFCKVINDIILESSIQLNSSSDKRLGVYFIKKADLVIGSKRFPEKVLKYLWDDAFKFSRQDVFNLNQYNNLESVIKGFNSGEGVERFKVFEDSVYEDLKNFEDC